MRASALGTAAALLALTPCAEAHEPRPSRFSWARDVRPLVRRHCLDCHREGGLGPMSLASYRDALPWAAAMLREVLDRRMPPWAPEQGELPLAGARLLSAREIDLLADWITGAAPEGDPAPDSGDEAAPVPPSSGPDTLTLAAERPVRLGPDEAEKTACLSLPSELSTPRWLAGVELRPENTRVVRRATIWAADGCPTSQAPLEVWVPGQAPRVFPDGAGVRIETAAVLSVRIDYVKRWDDDGLALTDASAVRLRFGQARRPVTSADLSRALRLDAPVDLVSLVAAGGPSGGGPLRVVAEAASGERTLLLEVRRPDPLWLGRYDLAEPLRLAAGTVLHSGGARIWASWTATPGAAAAGGLTARGCASRPTP